MNWKWRIATSIKPKTMSYIRYHGLWFQNGYAYRECEIPLDQQGLVLIRGLNVDDGGFLGAGKTSPFEVFSLLQTGRVGKQRSGERILADDVINLSVGNGFEARLRFDVDDKPYEIVQCRKHPKYGNAYRIIDVDAGRDILPASHQGKPQKWVAREVLSVDEKSFFNLIYLAQDFSNVMLHGTDGDRQQSLVQMFGLDVYDKLRKRAQDKLAVLRQTVQDIDALQDELQDIEDELQQLRQSPEAVATQLVTKQAELLTVQQQHDTMLNTMEDLQDLLRQVEQRIRLVRDIKQLWSEAALPVDHPRNITIEMVEQLDVNATEAADQETTFHSALQLIDQRDIIEQRLTTLGSCDADEAGAELETVRDELRRLVNEELPRAEQRLEITNDLRGLQRPDRSAVTVQVLLDEAQIERQKAEREIAVTESALANEVCPTCGQALQGAAHDPKELKRLLTTHRRDLKQSSVLVHDYTAELTNARQHEELKTRLQKIGTSAAPADIQREIGRLSREERRLVTLLEAENLRQTLQQQLATLPTDSPEQLRQKFQRARKRKQGFQRQYTAARSIWDKLGEIRELPKGKAQDLKGRIATATRKVREAAHEIVLLGAKTGRLERLHEKLRGLVRRQQKIQQGLQKTREARIDIQCLEALETAFGAKGLKRDRFTAILQDAAEQTVPYYTRLLWPKHNTEIALADLGGGIKFELRRDGLITGSRMISGGERNKAGLALLFGMRDLKERYTGLRTNVLLVDEPFGNLDAYGTDNLIRVLADQRDRFGTVMVVGNQRDVLMHDGWDQVWWVVREQHEARLYRKGLPERYRELAERYQRTTV